MKKYLLSFVSLLLIAAILAGCSKEAAIETAPSQSPATESTAAPELPPEETEADIVEEDAAESEEDFVYEGDASSYYIDVAYNQQIGRYYTPLCEKWDMKQYLANELSPLPCSYYEGNPLDNVGFGFLDLDNDGYWELIIGGILNAEEDPSVFEIWTLKDGEPVMLAQGSDGNRYVLQYVEEDEMWYVVNENSNSVDNFATYYLMLQDGKFEVVQGILYDALADAQNPWFMTHDLDWNISNDDPMDEETAESILEINRNFYTAVEYFPYIFY